MNKDSTDYHKWFTFADEDLAVVGILVNESGPYGAACAHAQQSAEKYLKGLLYFYGIIPPKIHDLGKLGLLLEDKNPGITDFRLQLEKLSEYYFESRYPGDFLDFTEDEAKGAQAAAIQIKEFVLKAINSSK